MMPTAHTEGLFIYYVIKGLLIGPTPTPLLCSGFVINLCSERYILAYPLPPSDDNVIYEQPLTSQVAKNTSRNFPIHKMAERIFRVCRNYHLIYTKKSKHSLFIYINV